MRHPRARLLTALPLVAVPIAAVFAQSPSLDDVLERAREAVARYEAQATLLVADEQCEQKAFDAVVERSGGPYSYTGPAIKEIPRGRRKWTAELAMARTPGLSALGAPWMEFRDVISVDGRLLPGHEQRLSRLFLEQTGWTLERAKQIANESARFNIGPQARTINTPNVPLLILHPANAGRFAFTRTNTDRVERVDGTTTWKVDFREVKIPTLISCGDSYCAATGSFWIDPASGEVVRTVLETAPVSNPEYPCKITVIYRRDEKLGMRVPFEMTEHSEGPSGTAGRIRMWVDGNYKYSNWRRFETAAKMIVPK